MNQAWLRKCSGRSASFDEASRAREATWDVPVFPLTSMPRIRARRAVPTPFTAWNMNGTVEFVQELDGNAYLLRLKSGPSSLGKVLDEMVRSDINLERLEIAPVTLEDVFLELTGNELRD